MKSCKVVTEQEGFPVSITGMTGDWTRLIMSDDTGGVMVSGVGYLKQGDQRGWHTHPKDEEEVLHIFRGTALVEWKDDQGEIHKVEAPAGTAIYTPGEVENNIRNPHSELGCVSQVLFGCR